MRYGTRKFVGLTVVGTRPSVYMISNRICPSRNRDVLCFAVL